MAEKKKRKRNANVNHDDFMYYVRSIELLSKMKNDKAITEEEYTYLKGCFMRDCQVKDDFMLGRVECKKDREEIELSL
jgi:hypothetical protein